MSKKNFLKRKDFEPLEVPEFGASEKLSAVGKGFKRAGKDIVRGFGHFGRDVAEGIYGASASAGDLLTGIASLSPAVGEHAKEGKKTFLKKARDINEQARINAAYAGLKPEEKNIIDELVVGGSEMAASLPKYALSTAAGGPITGFAGMGALESRGRGEDLKENIKAGVAGAATGAVFKGSGPLKRGWRIPTMSAGMGGMTALQGGDKKDVTRAAASGAILGAMGGKGKVSPKEMGRAVKETYPWTAAKLADQTGAIGGGLYAGKKAKGFTKAKGKFSNVADKAERFEIRDKAKPKSVSKRKNIINKLKEAKTNIIEYVQNSDERIRQLVERPDVKVSDATDPYLKRTLYSGRVANKVENAKMEAKGIIQDIKKSGLSRGEVSDYLISRHAPERNAALGEGAAGVTTKEALTRMMEIKKSPKGSKVESLANRVQALNNDSLDMLRDSGVISNELHTNLRQKYKNHVPLNRVFAETEDVGQVLSSKGYNVRSTGIKRAKGSSREVDDIMTNVLTNYEQAVLRSEKNLVDQSTLNFVRANQDVLGDSFQVVKPRAKGVDFQGKPIMERTTDPSILQMYENGKPIWIKVKDPKMAVAVQGSGRETLSGLMGAVGTITRLYSGLATRFNPEFAFSNKIRDLEEMAVYLSSQKKIGLRGAGKAIAGDKQSTMDVLDAIRGKKTEGSKLYDEMRALGGTTGGMGLSTRKKVEIDLAKLEKTANSKTRTVASNIVEYVDLWNTIFEDSTRLSVYKSALSKGLSKERAAFLAKEATINFNRMGKGGPVINAIWMFSNASIQGSMKMMRSLKDPKTLATTVATVGTATAAINAFNDKADPEWRNKVTKWDRLNGLPIVIPFIDDKKFRYVTIPVSWGLKPLKVISDYVYDATSGQDVDIGNFLDDAGSSIIEAYNPVGGTDIISGITPSVLDLPVDIARNRAWHGGKIKPDYDPNAPEDIKYFRSLKKSKLGEGFISLSELMHDKASVNISPADMKYAYDQLVSGAGRFTSKAFNLGSGIAEGKPPPVDEWPMVSRFYRERGQDEFGAGTQKEEDLREALENQSRSRFKKRSEALDIADELEDSPVEDKKAFLKKTAIEDPKKTERVLKAFKKRNSKSWEYYKIKQLGIENGRRAKHLFDEMQPMSKEEKKARLKELIENEVITEDVMIQLQHLKQKTMNNKKE